jgi:hypothetical protein
VTMVKKLLWVVFIITLVVTVFLIAMEQYYVAVALLLGVIIMWHREIWSLLTRRRMPPMDERVKENTGKAIRNGFIFVAAALAFLMLPFGEIVTDNLDTPYVLAALFIATGLVYMLSYLFYDRAWPKISPKRMKLLKTFLVLCGLSLPVFILGVFLHNALSALFNIEEPVFFVIAVIIAPLVFAVGLLGSLVLLTMGLVSRSS